MDYALIINHFHSSDYEVQLTKYYGKDVISVAFDIEDKVCTLIHFCRDEFHHLPQFYLQKHSDFGQLAHVLPSEDFEELSWICVNQLDSVSINFECPELVFEESAKRHIALIKKQINDPEFNKSELLREFRDNWYTSSKGLVGNSSKTVYCESNQGSFEKLQLYKPIKNDSVMSIPASFIALSSNLDSDISKFLYRNQRKEHQKSICYIVPLESVDILLPLDKNELQQWLLNSLEKVSPSVKGSMERKLFAQKAKEFWLLINFPTPSGKSWVGVMLRHADNKNRNFPNNISKISSWKVEPIYVDVFNKELMMPRSGAKPNISHKKVLMFGCGSVGSELADKLGSAGIGWIDIVDPDHFSTSNIYRHTLNKDFTNWPKSIAVSLALTKKYPWLKSSGYSDNLLNCRKKDFIESYDLIIIAIGNPTHERLFHDYIVSNKVNVPIIYTWLEGYGIGGHAVLDIPNKKGCLRCAYVEPNTGIRGLASNLNFIESDQDVVKNYAGCGEMFIPYGAINSTQTALIAADLAVSYLSGGVDESVKSSWKGDSSDAKAEGLQLSQRYNHFEASLKKQPLSHPLCDICNSDEQIIFQREDGFCVYIPQSLYKQLFTYRQLETDIPEAAGLLIGYYKENGDICLDSITLPKDSDERKRAYFKLDAAKHQKEIEEAYNHSDQILGYVGTWHTHPEKIPTPSNIDTVDWGTHDKENPERQLCFIIIGTQELVVYLSISGEIVQLTKIESF